MHSCLKRWTCPKPNLKTNHFQKISGQKHVSGILGARAWVAPLILKGGPLKFKGTGPQLKGLAICRPRLPVCFLLFSQSHPILIPHFPKSTNTFCLANLTHINLP